MARYGSRFTLVEVLVVIAIIALVAGLLGGGAFVSESKAVQALETHGFSDIRILDKDYFFMGGGKDDSVRFRAHAVNPAGKQVEVYVYAGLWKGATVRTP